MIRESGKTTDDEDNELQDNNDVPDLDLWRMNPWLTSHMIGSAHSQCTDAAEQQRGHAMFTALGERSASAIMQAEQDEHKKEA